MHITKITSTHRCLCETAGNTAPKKADATFFIQKLKEIVQLRDIGRKGVPNKIVSVKVFNVL